MTKKNNTITYISILRGINVGGHKKIKMDALRQLYSSQAYESVQSYIQSGNVIFRTNETDTKTLASTLSTKIQEAFGFDVPVLVLTAQELKCAIDDNPYLDDSTKDPASLHLTFLSTLPDKALVEKLPINFTPDEFCIIGKVIYIHCPNGYGNTKLTNTFFENKLKLSATCRNLKTCTELAALSQNF
jgi:uncharacterized protein (DUF1697 family)